MVIFDLHVTSDNNAIALADRGKVYIWNLSKVLNLELHSDTGDSTSTYKPTTRFTLSDNAYYSI